MDAVPGGTGVFYQAMPAVGVDGKNIMKLIPVKVVDGQFIQTPISKHKVGPTPQNPVSMNIASAPAQAVKKAALNPSAAQQVVRNQVFHINTVPKHGDLNPQNSLNKDSLQRHTVKFIDKVPQIGTPATNYEKLERLSGQLPVTVKSPALPRGQYLQIPPNAQVRTVPASELPPGIKKQIFTSSANSSPSSGLPSVVYVSPITTVNQSVIPLRDSALSSPKLLPKTSNETLCGPQSKESKPRLKLIQRFSQRPNSPIKWTVEEEESSTSPTCDPLHSSTVTSKILRTVAERENADKHSNIIMKPVSPLTEDKSGQGRENALVMCNGKVFFVAKKHSIPPKIGKNDPPTSAIKSDELKKNMVPSSQPLFVSAAPEIRQDLKIIIPDESDEVIDLCDDDAQDGSTQKPASVNMSSVSHVDEDNVIFVSYIPPKSVSGSTQHLKLKAQMALVTGTDQTSDCLSNSLTEQRNLDGARGSNGRDEVVAHRGRKPGQSMAVSPVKDPKYFCGSGMMNMHDNEDLNINCQQSTSTQQLESMEVDVATGSPADPADEVCFRTKEDTHKMESSVNPTTSRTSSQEPKSHQMDDHSLRQIFGITADVKICLQRIEEPVMSGEHSQKPTSRLSDGELFLQYLYTPDVTERDSGLLSVKHEIELADQEISVDAAIPSHHAHSRPLRCSNFKLKTKPFPALMCNSGQSLLKATSCDVIDYVTPIDEDFLSTDENEILNSQNTDATLQTPSFLDLNANPRRICRTRKRTICPCCMPGTQDPAFKSSTKAVEPEKWAWTTEPTSKKSGRTKVVRKSVKPSGRINFLTAKNKLNFKSYEVPSSGSLCSTSMNSNELKQQEEIKRLKELLREKEAALELMRNSIS